MSITDYKDNISRDNDVLGDQVYFDNGQGCGTIWFKSVPEARKFIAKHGRIGGYHSGLCVKCQCHYSIRDREHKKFKPWICNEWAEKLKREV